MTSQYLQTLQRLFIPDLRGGKVDVGRKQGEEVESSRVTERDGQKRIRRKEKNKRLGEKVADLGHAKNGLFSQQCSCPISPPLH